MELKRNIWRAYEALIKKGKNSSEALGFSLKPEMYIDKLVSDIQNHTLQPLAYTFVVTYPKPREIFASDLATRILHYYIDVRLRPILESLMTDRNFNNRKGLGQIACINSVISDVYEASKGYTEDCYIIKLDIKGCFPNINQDVAFKMLKDVVLKHYHEDDKDTLLYILSRCVFAYPIEHCERRSSTERQALIDPEKSLFNKPKGVGAPIGHLLWQITVNYYFNSIDQWMIENGIRYNRYVDDMYMVGSKDLLLIIPQIREMLKPLGAKLNEKKFYCQHWSKGFECLGYHVKIDRVYPNNRVIRKAKQRARQFNRCIRPNKVAELLACLNSYLGICKNCNGFARAWEIVNCLDKRWFGYIKFNRERVCLQALPAYTERNQIIRKYNLTKLNYDTKRKIRKNASATRKATCTALKDERK